MKKYIFSFSIVLLFFSCNEIEIGDAQQGVVTDLIIHVSFENEFNQADKEGITVSVTNPFQEEFTLTTDANGDALLANAIVGNYSIVVSHSLSESAVRDLTGNIISGNLPFNGSISVFSLSPETQDAEIVLEAAGSIGDILIKQIYYSGSDNAAGSTRDSFIELYNNSNETIFLDRWYIGNAERTTSSSVRTRSDDGVQYTFEDGKFNWDTSLDFRGVQAEGDKNEDFIYARELYQFPGGGQDYPLDPGQSVVIAKTALNHKLKVGTNEPVEKPELTVDLSNADFEVYYVSNFDVDILTVPNLNIIQERRIAGNDLILDAFGRIAIFILRDNANVAAYPEFLRPDRDADDIGVTRYYFMQIPVPDIVDAVDGNRFDADRQVAKAFPSSVDVGFVSNPGGLRGSEAVIRRITPASANNDRKVLVDTNNSFEDFIVQFPTPGGF